MSSLPRDDPSYNWRDETPQFLVNQCLPSPVFLDLGQPLAPDSYQRLHEIQRAYCLRFLQMEPDYLFTIRFSHPLRPPEMYDRLKRFDKLATDLCFGHKGYRLPESERIEWWAAAEDDSHLHMLIRQPEHGRRLVRYDSDDRGCERYGRIWELSVFLTEMVQESKIAKDVDAERIDPCRLHVAASYLLKRAWSKRVADSHERDLIYHSSFFHTRNQRCEDHRDSVPSLRLAASPDPLAVTV